MEESQSKEVMTNHQYDGIQEYDNPVPFWMSAIFILTILYSIGYMIWLHGGEPGRSWIEEYNAGVAENLRKQFKDLGTLKPDADTIRKYMDEPEWLKVGAIVFQTNCISCHGGDGKGNVGPNLCDEHYKNVNTIEDVAKVIGGGAAGQAMPAWGTRLHPNELVLVSSYVAKLRGTAGGSGKAPEGKVIPPWPEAKKK